MFKLCKLLVDKWRGFYLIMNIYFFHFFIAQCKKKAKKMELKTKTSNKANTYESFQTFTLPFWQRLLNQVMQVILDDNI